MAFGRVNTGGGSGKSKIIVSAPSGSIVTCSNGTGAPKTAPEKNGIWTFNGCDIGIWTITATLGEQTAMTTVNITEEGQKMRYYVSISYQAMVTDFNWDVFGALGVDYEIVYDDDTPIPQEEWATAKNWKARLLTSNTLIPLKDSDIDVFLLGGGGNGGNGKEGREASAPGGGGGGGYTATYRGVPVVAGTEYEIIIGGASSASSGFGLSAAGGSDGGNANYNTPGIGGSGGSGGGTGASYAGVGGAGGSDGSDGNVGLNITVTAGEGQGTTTREFAEATGKLYGGGGGGGSGGVSNDDIGAGGDGGGGDGGTGKSNLLDDLTGKDGTPNTGGGGGGGGSNWNNGGAGGAGGSGIVVIRPAQGEAA